MRLARSFATLSVLTLGCVVACAPKLPAKQTKVIAATTPDGGAQNQGTGRCTPWIDPRAEAAAAAKATKPAEPDEEPGYDASGRRKVPLKKTDLCETADSNLARAEAAILESAGGAASTTTRKAWDHKTKPERFDRVASRLALTKAERDLITKNGFVVMSRNTHSTYAWALHEIYQSELPIYISADSILHAVYTSNDHLLADIERETLVPLLARTLSAMHCALADASAAKAYPSEVARDLDVYLTVARSLLADAAVPSVLGMDDQAAKLVAAAKKASGIQSLEMFGRERLVDWSQYQPRGHYADGAGLAPNPDDPNAAPPEPNPDDAAQKSSLSPYFRAGMWLSRLEFNLVSRSSRSSLLGLPDPRETPREAIVGLALADLVERSAMLDDVAKLDHAWALLAGRREDVSIAAMIGLKKKAGIASIDLASFDKLKTAIGNDYQRTARIHPMPEGSKVLPAISTFLGPRIVADTAAFRPLVHSEVTERYLIGAGDVAYVLGLDRGKTYLKDDLAKHSNLSAKLDEARKSIETAKDAGDLYGAWLGAVRGVAEKPKGTVPSFMTTEAYDDLRMNTIIAGYGQIRHNYVLMAAQAYDEGGCEIPDGWVEPLPAAYQGIAKYAARGKQVMKELDPKDDLKTVAYFAELEKVARVLETIATHELEGRALSTEEKRFLSMVVEMLPGGTGGAPSYTGWYFDLFRGRWEEGLGTASFVADYYTSSWKEKVVYAGASSPRMGVFVIDTGGGPRMAVGPVARAYEIESSLAKRLDDQAAIAAEGKRDPWAASYTAPSIKAPALAVAADFTNENKPIKVTLRAGAAPLTNVTIELLDHHRFVVTSTTRSIAANGKVVWRTPYKNTVQGLRIRVGEFSAESFGSSVSQDAALGLGGMEVDYQDFAN